jgi:hypothetical protein
MPCTYRSGMYRQCINGIVTWLDNVLHEAKFDKQIQRELGPAIKLGRAELVIVDLIQAFELYIRWSHSVQLARDSDYPWSGDTRHIARFPDQWP